MDTADDSPQTLAPVAAEVAVDPITAIIQQVQAVITQIVGVINQVVTQVVAFVNQVVTAIVSIFVPVGPVNTAPTGTTPTVGTPDPASGSITGTVSATDKDGDTLTYSAPATTSKGSVVIDASTGAFTYMPTVAARENAAKAGATAADKSDTFTVTVTDGYGGSTTVAVPVSISPAPMTVGLASSEAAAYEGADGTRTISLVVRLSGPSDQQVTVDYSVGSVAVTEQVALAGQRVRAAAAAARPPVPPENAATPGEDFLAKAGKLVFAPGQTEATISVTINGDRKSEFDEVLQVALTNANNVLIANGVDPGQSPVLTFTIRNDDPTVGFVGGVVGIDEPIDDGATKVVEVPLELSLPSDQEVTVSYYLAGVTASAGQDYLDQTGTVVFAPGQTRKIIPVTIYGDSEYEGWENVGVIVTSVTGSIMVQNGAEQGRLNRYYIDIYSEDRPSSPTVGFVGDLGVIDEPVADGASKVVDVPLELSFASDEEVTVSYFLNPQSASAGQDYLDQTGTVAFAPGQTRAIIPVTIYGDNEYEGQEYVFVDVTSVTGGQMVIYGAEEGRHRRYGILIQSEDRPSIPTVGFVGGGGQFDEPIDDGATRVIELPLELSFASDQEVTVSYAFSGYADAGKDYLDQSGTVVFQPGQTRKIIPVTIYGDNEYEGIEALFVNVTSATGAQLVIYGAEPGRFGLVVMNLVSSDPYVAP